MSEPKDQPVREQERKYTAGTERFTREELAGPKPQPALAESPWTVADEALQPEPPESQRQQGEPQPALCAECGNPQDEHGGPLYAHRYVAPPRPSPRPRGGDGEPAQPEAAPRQEVEMDNPLKPIRGPFKVRGGGGWLEVSLLPDGLVTVDMYQGQMRAGPPETLLGQMVISSLNWAQLMSEMGLRTMDPTQDPNNYRACGHHAHFEPKAP